MELTARLDRKVQWAQRVPLVRPGRLVLRARMELPARSDHRVLPAQRVPLVRLVRLAPQARTELMELSDHRVQRDRLVRLALPELKVRSAHRG